MSEENITPVNTETPVTTGGEFTIPESYKDQAWAKNIKSTDDLFNQFANSQKLLGKKGVIVPESFDDEKMTNQFYDQIGRPKDPSEYELDPNDARSKELEDKIKAVLHKSGLTKHQAKTIQKEYGGIITEMITKAEADKQAALVKLESDFEADMVKTLGADWPKAAEQGRLFVESRLTTDAQKEALTSMSNAQLGVLSHLANEFRKELAAKTGEDTHQKAGSGSGITDGGTYESLMAKSRELLKASKVEKDPMKANQLWKDGMGLIDKAVSIQK